jgi:hypothetical protein
MILGPLISAGKIDLANVAPGPDMGSAIVGWCRPMKLGVQRIRAGAGGDAETFTRFVETSGVLLASKPQKLLIKDSGEGTRNWKWWTLYTLTDPKAQNGDVLEIDGRQFKILEVNDRLQFGYMRYVCVEDFKP